jgi:acyl carrier protein
MKTLQEKLTDLLNAHSVENGSNTPDFILAEYLLESLRAYERAVVARERWYGRVDEELPLGVCSEDEPLPVADQIEAAILEWLHETAIIDKDTQIDEDASISEIGIDSLDMVHLTLALEKQFEVSFPDSFAPKTYRELVDGAVEIITNK